MNCMNFISCPVLVVVETQFFCERWTIGLGPGLCSLLTESELPTPGGISEVQTEHSYGTWVFSYLHGDSTAIGSLGPSVCVIWD